MSLPKRIRLKDLRGEWAVVTGASSGIGLAFTKELVCVGCNVVMVSNEGPQLETCRRDILATSGSIELKTLDLDLSRDDAAEVLCEALSGWAIVPLLLVNNAGIFNLNYISDLSERRLNLFIDLHIRTVTLLTRRMAMLMEANGRGYILNMASLACWLPMPGISMYAATKAYIWTMTRSLRTEWRDRGVSLMAACPGGIATDLFGLPLKLQKLGVALGILVTPKHFVHRALRKCLHCQAKYVNGPFNHIAVPLVNSLPEWFRVWGKKKLLGK